MRNPELLKKDWPLYVADMIGFATKVLTYTDGLNQREFIASKLNYDATMRNLCMVSDAATNIPTHIHTIASPINWQKIIGLHDKLIRSYWTIDNGVVWSIIQNEIPLLIAQLETLKNLPHEN